MIITAKSFITANGVKSAVAVFESKWAIDGLYYSIAKLGGSDAVGVFSSNPYSNTSLDWVAIRDLRNELRSM